MAKITYASAHNPSAVGSCHKTAHVSFAGHELNLLTSEIADVWKKMRIAKGIDGVITRKHGPNMTCSRFRGLCTDGTSIIQPPNSMI